jgi:hypothetical protein
VTHRSTDNLVTSLAGNDAILITLAILQLKATTSAPQGFPEKCTPSTASRRKRSPPAVAAAISSSHLRGAHGWACRGLVRGAHPLLRPNALHRIPLPTTSSPTCLLLPLPLTAVIFYDRFWKLPDIKAFLLCRNLF